MLGEAALLRAGGGGGRWLLGSNSSSCTEGAKQQRKPLLLLLVALLVRPLVLATGAAGELARCCCGLNEGLANERLFCADRDGLCRPCTEVDEVLLLSVPVRRPEASSSVCRGVHCLSGTITAFGEHCGCARSALRPRASPLLQAWRSCSSKALPIGAPSAVGSARASPCRSEGNGSAMRPLGAASALAYGACFAGVALDSCAAAVEGLLVVVSLSWPAPCRCVQQAQPMTTFLSGDEQYSIGRQHQILQAKSDANSLPGYRPSTVDGDRSCSAVAEHVCKITTLEKVCRPDSCLLPRSFPSRPMAHCPYCPSQTHCSCGRRVNRAVNMCGTMLAKV